MPSNFAQNLGQGLRVGYGIGTDMIDRHREQDFRDETAAATAAGGDLSTAELYGKYRAGMQAAYNKKGDVAGGLAVDKAIGEQLKGRLTDGLQQVYSLAKSGTPEAMQEAAALIPKVYSYFPNGQTVHTTYNPQDHSVYVTPIDEKTGQPVQNGHGYALNPENLMGVARGYLETLPEMEASDLAKAHLEEEKRHAGVAEGIAQQGVDVQREGVGVQRAGVAAEYAGINERSKEHADSIALGNKQLVATIGAQEATNRRADQQIAGQAVDREMRRQQWDEGRAGREASVANTLADADLRIAQATKGGNDTWTPQQLTGVEGLVNRQAKIISDANAMNSKTGVSTVDPTDLSSDAMSIISSNKPGTITGSGALTTVQAWKANPDNYDFKPNGAYTLVIDKKTGDQVVAPTATVSKVFGRRINPASIAVPGSPRSAPMAQPQSPAAQYGVPR